MPARLRIRQLADAGTFVELAPEHAIPRAPRLYARHVYRASRRKESVLSGTATVTGLPVVLVAFDFRVTGGTMGVTAGEMITRAFEYAAQHQLPIVAVIASGGVRIQEGMPALLQMVRTVQARLEFERVGRPFIAVMTNPTTGGVYASFTSLADILLAEPGATIGFAGPRVAQAVTGEKPPEESHRSEAALANGMIDAIVERQALRNNIASLLTTLAAQPAGAERRETAEQLVLVSSEDRDVLALTRNPDRPTARDYISRLVADFIELHGDRLLGDDPRVIGGIGILQKRPVMVIAQQRSRHVPNERGPGPAGYRKAERLIRFAGHVGLPIVTFVDTPGADPGLESERFGIAGAIAYCLAALIQTPVPTVAAIIGEGSSGGALALGAADRVLMQANATYEVISPEGAAAILYGDDKRAADTVGFLGITAEDLVPRGIVDEIIPEPAGGAHTDPVAAAALVGEALTRALDDLAAQTNDQLLSARRNRFRGRKVN